MKKEFKRCFVCQNVIISAEIQLNTEVNLWVCSNCRGTKNEDEKVKELLDSLADGFVCGCI